MDTALLSNSMIAKLKKYSFSTSKRVSYGYQGNRQATGFGRTLDFSDYRNYHLGDDLRQIDWNVYARTNKHYIKRFLDEKDIQVTVYLDCSASMKSEKLKWFRLKQIAAMLGYIALVNGDRLSVIPIGLSENPFLHKKGVGYSHTLFHYLTQLTENSHNEYFASLLQYRQKHTNIHILITDGYEKRSTILEKLHQFQTSATTIFIQLSTSEEISPSLKGDRKLIDRETSEFVDVTLQKSTIDHYKSLREEHFSVIKEFCKRRGIRYISLDANEELEENLKRIKKEGFFIM
ncbi:DUF58 domain-containing protein [Alkalihalobacillus trypoxylicola]|uniref:DUF58 domain-containing protein n=1 Tax=Alkalihalobacillus trypoxylicola TaxID=519424 RepID=A0A161P4J0_9BACI|nr:DUF58 domain-containing protein [Alkalihalobacillus trypoxylicola]KYG25546.1 hypothetical protein AZF04_13730 [Alkalihalobacillus trypoxylicola]